jgi:transcriptional regulator with XRE-family HTH domain
VDVRTIIRQRLGELGLEQRDLAAAAKVTESYISQLLTRKKPPPAPNRTDIYPKMEKVLRLSPGRLSELAVVERTAELKKHLASTAAPLLRELRELALRKCVPANEPGVRAIFEKDPFGELEHFVTQKLLDVTKRVVKEELENEGWLRLVARLSRRSYEELRVSGLEFLDTDVFNVSVADCAAFLDPLLESWEIDLTSFSMTVQLNRRLVLDYIRRLEFVERELARPPEEMVGFEEFLKDPTMSGGASEDEIEFLRRLRFKGRVATALYYYRELQNLRDPIHFHGAVKGSHRSPRKFGGGS